MKSGLSRERIITCVIAFVAVILGVLVFSNSLKNNKTFAYDTGIQNVAAYVDENDNPTTAYFVLESLNSVDLTTMDSNSFKITSSADISFFDPVTKNEIASEDGIVGLTGSGIGVKVSNLSRGVKYDVTIKPEDVKKGYKVDFKKAVIELDYTSSLTAKIKQMVDSDNNEININDNDNMVFLYTEDDNIVRMRAREDVDIEYYYSLDPLSDQELQNIHWNVYDKSTYLEVTTNGYLYGKAKYKTTTYSEINMLRITNIDKLDPSVTLISQELTDNNTVNITYNYKDALETKEYGDSGVIKHTFSTLPSPPASQYDDTTDDQTVVQEVTENGTYYACVKDQAGNGSCLRIDVTIIPDPPLENCLFIIDSSENSLIATQYTRLSDMVNAITDAGVTRDGIVVAQLECNIMNQQVSLNNMDLTIDLNGYSISSNSDTPVFTVTETANLTVLDEKYDLGTFFNTIANREYDFNNGNEYIYVAPADGVYKLEAWGAQGGNSIGDFEVKAVGGYGGYSVGEVTLTKNQRLYINVGGKGANAEAGHNSQGGYNGGGHGTYDNEDDDAAGGGGGATHVALDSGAIMSFNEKRDKLLIVAGGGGGAAWSNQGGSGGGFTGGAGGNSNTANQTSGNAFGQGQDGDGRGDSRGMGGAGGGFYGGYTNLHDNTAGSGGSGYIGNSLLTSKQMVCYNCEESSETSTKTVSTSSYSSTPTALTAKEGNGYVRITGVDIEVDTNGIDITNFTHGEGVGKIINSATTAVNVVSGGVLQLGKDNSPDRMHVEEPNTEAPYLYGKNYAVGSEGSLNFYDGVLVGTRALDGDVSDTPFGYDASTTTDDDTNEFIMTVRRLTNVEALIGRTRYTTIEQAINAANNYIGTKDDVIKIDIIKDLEKETVVEIPADKNINIDLNGHEWIVLATTPVIRNFGQTRLMDSVGGGKVYTTKVNVISNEYGGKLYFNSGEIEVNNGYSNNANACAIVNNGGSYFEMNGGIIKATGQRDCNIYNYGNVVFNDGEMNINRHDYSITGVNVYNFMLAQNAIVTSTYNVKGEDFNADPNNQDKFITNPDGSISSAQLGTLRAVSRGLYALDLRTKSTTDKFKVTMTPKGQMNSGALAYAHAVIDPEYKSATTTYNRFFYFSSAYTAGDYSLTLEGGRIWYITFTYNTGSSFTAETDFSVDIKVENYAPFAGNFTMNGGSITNSGNYSSRQAVTNGGYNYEYATFTLNGGTIYNIFGNGGRFFQNGGRIENTLNNGKYFEMTNGYVGTVQNATSQNTLYGQYTKPNGTYISNGTINNFKSSDNGMVLDMTGGTILDGLTVSNSPTSISNAHIFGTSNFAVKYDINVSNTTFDEGAVSITGTAQYYVDDHKITFDNCDFNKNVTSSENNTPYFIHITRSGSQDLILKNSRIKYKLTDNYTGTRAEDSRNVYVGLNNLAVGYVTLDNTKIDIETNPDNGLYGYAIGTYTSINGIGFALFNSNPDETGPQSTVYTLGNKDGNYVRDSFHINSDTYGILLTSDTYSMYDGYIQAKKEPFSGLFKEVESGYAVNKYTEDGYNIIDLSNSIKNIYYVEGDKYFAAFDGALKYLNDNNIDTATLKLLGDYNYIVKSENSVIRSGLTLTVDLNGKDTFINDIVNNGNLTFIDTADTSGNVKIDTLINNNQLSINGGKWSYNISGASALTNNGVLNYGNSINFVEAQYGIESKRYPILWYSNSSVLVNENKKVIENNGIVNISDGFSYSTPDDSKLVTFINNHSASTVNITGGNIEISKRIVFIDNYGGKVNVSGGNFSDVSADYGQIIRSTPEWTGDIISTGISTHVEEFFNIALIQHSSNISGEFAIPITAYENTGTVTVEIETSAIPGTTNTYTPSKFKLTNSLPGIPTYADDDIAEYSNDRGLYKCTADAGSNYYLHINLSTTELLTGGRYYFNDHEDVHEFSIQPEVTITGGTINNKIVEAHGGSVNVTGGTINGVGTFKVMNNTDLTIDGVDGNSGFVYLSKGGSVVDIKNSNIALDNAYAIYSDVTGIVKLDNVRITGGENNGGWNALYLNSALEMKNSTIDVSGTSDTNAVYINRGKATITNSTIKNNGAYRVHGIGVYGGADVSVENTTVNATGTDSIYGIFMENNNSILTLGTNDDTVSTVNPSVAGDNYGVYLSGGNFKFYDGILKGKTDALYGTVTAKPDQYELKYDTEDSYTTAILFKDEIVENKVTHTRYGSVNSAIGACTENESCSLLLLKDINITENILVPSNKIVELDLGGKTINTSITAHIENRGQLTTTNGTIKIPSGENTVMIENYGKFIVNEGTTITINGVKFTKALNNYVGAEFIQNAGLIDGGKSLMGNGSETNILNNTGGTITINGGTLTSTGTAFRAQQPIYLISSNSDSSTGTVVKGTVNINGGTINGSDIASHIKAVNTDVHITGGTLESVNGGGNGVVTSGTSTVEFTGGTIKNRKISIQLEGDNSILYGEPTGETGGTITTANIDSAIGVKVIKGSIDISKLKIEMASSNQIGVDIATRSDVRKDYKLKNSSITIDGTSNPRGINYIIGGNLILEDTTINVSGTSSTFAILNEIKANVALNIGSSLTIKRSKVIATSTADNDGTAIRLIGVYGHFDVNIGEKDNVYSRENTLIKGSENALYCNGYDFTFYDGELQGKYLYSVGPSDFEDGYTFTTENNDGVKKGYLVPATETFENESTHEKYNYLQDAISACGASQECRLTQLKDYYLDGEAIIPSDKNITINLNEKNIHVSTGNYISNNGTLTVKNGNVLMESAFKGQSFVNNYGTLNLDDDIMFDCRYLMGINMIYNSSLGTVNINDGTYLFTKSKESYNNYVPSIAYAQASSITMYGHIINNEGGIINVNDGLFDSYYLNDDYTHGSDTTYGYYGILNTAVFTGTVVNYETNEVPIKTKGFVNSDFTTGGYYIPLDLRDFSGDVTIDIYDTMSKWDNKTKVRGKITESTDVPVFTSNPDFEESGTNYPRLNSFTRQGGKMYYLHISGGWEHFVLNNIVIHNDSKSVRLFSPGTVNVNGGEFIGGGHFVANLNGNVYLNDGLYNSNLINFDGYVEVNGGTLKNHMISNTTIQTKMIINDLDIIIDSTPLKGAIGLAGDTVINDLNATVSVNVKALITDGTVYGGAVKSNTVINNLTINASNQNNASIISYTSSYDTENRYKLIVNNCNINVESTATTNYVYGITSSSSILEMKGGNINITGNYGSGLYGYKMTVGTNDAYVVDASPVISAPTYALYNTSPTTSVVRYYDGTLKTPLTGTPIQGNIDDMPDQYIVDIKTTTEEKIATLRKESAFENTFEYNGIFYDTLDMAIAMIESESSKTGTIKIWNDAQLEESTNIPAGTNITIMLEGHTLDYTGVSVGIINNGTLTILDGEAPDVDANTISQIINTTGTAIQNNGSLTIGKSGNLNPSSPKIIGNIAIAGTAATVNSGTVTSTGNVGTPRYNNALEPSFSYKYSNLQVNVVPNTVALAVKPGIRSVDDLTVWTNQNLHIGLTSHNYGVLNVFSKVDENQTKKLKYTVEVYKNGILDEYNTFDHEIEVQVLHDDNLPVDMNYFDNIKTQFKGYYLTRMVINDEDTTVIPEDVNNGTVFKLYYGQEKGDEIEIVNPKTGRKSYSKGFIVTLCITASLIIGVVLYNKLKLKEE